MHLKSFLYITLLAFLITSSGCQVSRERESAIIRLKGSDTMLILANRWAEAYMLSHPGVSIYAEGGGSTAGLESLIEEDVDIAMASRLIRTGEARQLAERFQSIGIAYLVAKDALSIYLNRSNPVDNLTVGELKEIFSGTINNWKYVGGPDRTITLALRPPTSGTYLYFRRFVMDDLPFLSDHQTFPTTRSLIDYIEQTPDAIGFGGIAYGEKVKHCAIEGIAPTPENVKADLYPLSRYLYLYTVNKPSREIRLFIDWIMGKQGQQIVSEIGYIPIWISE